MFGYVAADIDCAFRLFRRSVLEMVPLNSTGAMISTELLVGARSRGFHIKETTVTHVRRRGGEATGANLHVILRAFADLLAFRLELSRQLRAERVAVPASR
jgi:hypothetical protein